MDRAQMQTVMSELQAKCQELQEAGQKEYAHDEGNAFRNFESIAEDLNLTREEVLLVYLKKHLDGITAFVVHGEGEQRESIFGRIEDSIVYLNLLAGMLVDRETEHLSEKESDEVFDQLVKEML